MDDQTVVPPANAGELIDILTLAVVRQDVAVLSISKADLDHLPRLRRLVGAVAGTRAQIPAGMDSVGGSLAVPTILVVTNALVTGVLGQGRVPDSARPRRLGWIGRRMLAWRLGRRLAAAGAATPLPVLSPGQITQALAEVRSIAVNARLTERETDDLCACLEAILAGVARR